MTTTGKLSPQFSKLALQFAEGNVPGFKEFCALPNDSRLAITTVTDTYINGTEDLKDRERRLEAAKQLKMLLAGDTKRRTLVIGEEISSVLLPICFAATEIERKKEEERQRIFKKISRPYSNLASFIIGLTRTKPPRVDPLMAKGMLIGFGLATPTGSTVAAASVTLGAKKMLHGRLIGISFVNDRDEMQDPHPKEFEQGAWYLRRLIGCTSDGARIGYRPLETGEPFDHIVQTVAKKYSQLNPDKATRAAEEEVSRQAGYVLDKIL